MEGENKNNFLVHYLFNRCWKYVWLTSKKIEGWDACMLVATSKNFPLFDYFDTKSFYFQFGNDVFSTLKKVRIFHPFLNQAKLSISKKYVHANLVGWQSAPFTPTLSSANFKWAADLFFKFLSSQILF